MVGTINHSLQGLTCKKTGGLGERAERWEDRVVKIEKWRGPGAKPFGRRGIEDRGPLDRKEAARIRSGSGSDQGGEDLRLTGGPRVSGV